MLEINSSQIRRSELTKYLIDYMRVFFLIHFLAHLQQHRQMTKFRSFFFSLKNVGVRWFTETILFSQELFSLVYELHYLPPPPPPNYISQVHCDKGSTDEEISL